MGRKGKDDSSGVAPVEKKRASRAGKKIKAKKAVRPVSAGRPKTEARDAGGESTPPAAGCAMTRQALVPALWKNAVDGHIPSIEMLRKLGLLEEVKSYEAERVLLELIDRMLATPGLCEADEGSVDRD